MAVTQRTTHKYRNALIAPFPAHVLSRLFTTAEDVTIPAACSLAIFKPDVDCWARTGGTAAAATDITDGTGSTLLKGGGQYWYAVSPGQVISVFASATCLLSVDCYMS